MKIQITEQDITGAGTDIYNCPLARALQRIFETEDATVSLGFCEIDGKTYGLGPAGVNFVRRLCFRQELGPCEIDIFEITDWSMYEAQYNKGLHFETANLPA
jgi:hypothetical protein